jgi:hypothetical protein
MAATVTDTPFSAVTLITGTPEEDPFLPLFAERMTSLGYPASAAPEIAAYFGLPASMAPELAAAMGSAQTLEASLP